ncbi:MAG: M23 family metallopeptidase [Planctomycetes bacterium]|nr:M23 family metallopeptidase [Planctomycetota bacterium]
MKANRTQRLDIQPIPRAVFVQLDRWTKSWMYHLKIRETRGVAVRIVQATFDVMGKDGLLRRDIYDEERLAQRIKPMTIMRHWLRPSSYERKGSSRIPANGERRMCDLFYSHHKTLPVVEMRHVFRCEDEKGKTFRVRFNLPLMESKQRTKLRLPFGGRWIMALGFEFFEHHGRGGGLGNDFVRLGPDSLPFKGKGRRVTDWHCYGEPVLAPADGIIRAVRRDSRDNIPLRPVADRGEFNYIHIEHFHREQTFLAHLKHNSICVDVGQKVKAGQKLGECGNTGIVTVCPHIHIGFRVGEYPVPPLFHDVRVFYPVELEEGVYAPSSVTKKAVLRHGQIVENAK